MNILFDAITLLALLLPTASGQLPSVYFSDVKRPAIPMPQRPTVPQTELAWKTTYPQKDTVKMLGLNGAPTLTLAKRGPYSFYSTFEEANVVRIIKTEFVYAGADLSGFKVTDRDNWLRFDTTGAIYGIISGRNMAGAWENDGIKINNMVITYSAKDKDTLIASGDLSPDNAKAAAYMMALLAMFGVTPD